MTESFIRNGIFYTTAIAHLCNCLPIKVLFDSLFPLLSRVWGSAFWFFVFWTEREKKSQKEWELKLKYSFDV